VYDESLTLEHARLFRQLVVRDESAVGGFEAGDHVAVVFTSDATDLRILLVDYPQIAVEKP